MNQNNYMELIIDGKIYKMGGAEDEMYRELPIISTRRSAG